MVTNARIIIRIAIGVWIWDGSGFFSYFLRIFQRLSFDFSKPERGLVCITRSRAVLSRGQEKMSSYRSENDIIYLTFYEAEKKEKIHHATKRSAPYNIRIQSSSIIIFHSIIRAVSEFRFNGSTRVKTGSPVMALIRIIFFVSKYIMYNI